jgi:ABC-type polysaccharide/polyol phosphate export permease
MAKDTITVGGEERVVREDTARSYRGVVWALLSVLAFIIIMAIVFFGGFLSSATDGDMKSPSQIEQKRQ